MNKFTMNKKIMLTILAFALSACSTTDYCASQSRVKGSSTKQVEHKASKIREDLKHTGVAVAAVGSAVYLTMPGNVTFDTNSAKIKPEFNKVLNSVVNVVNTHSDSDIRVLGHTDNTGSDALNNRLSKQRADSVATYLKNKGVDGERITTDGRGSKSPVATNSTPEGREKNRRIEIVLDRK